MTQTPQPPTFDAILRRLLQLTPEQQRRLVERLRAVGILPSNGSG